MFVDYSTFNEQWSASGITEEEYECLAPIADSIVDDWTLGRVGRAVRNGEELPECIVTLYCLTMKNIPGYMEATGEGGHTVSSFSNGVDSYSFVTDETITDVMRSQLGWYIDTLPIEWISRAAHFEGGNKYAG